MSTVKKYLSLVKFSHTIFAMPFALIGFFLGLIKYDYNFFTRQWALNSTVGWRGGNSYAFTTARDSLIYKMYNGGDPYFLFIEYFLLVILCMVFARSAAMAFNRYLDRSFDSMNPRTAIREIPAGILKANSVLWFTVVNCILFIACTFFINRLCFFLSLVALFVVLGYSYTKRFTPFCHFILGLGLSLAPIGAYLAVTGRFSLLPVLFSFAVIFWVSGFDIIYALQDEEFDKAQKLYSIPAWLGRTKGLRVSELLHLFSAACVFFAGVYGGFGWLYWMGVAIFAGMLIYQHAIVKPDDLRRVNLAFMTTNGIASILFAIFVIADLFLHS
jgi:4-hydroxybenzoate polyprenyltransferase